MSARHLHLTGVVIAAILWLGLAWTTPFVRDPTEYISVQAGWRPSAVMFVIWAVGLASLALTSRQPLTGIATLFLFEYGVPRYTADYQFMLQLRLPELAAAFTFAGWLIWRRERGAAWLPDRPLLPGLMAALLVWVALSAIAAATSGEVWQPSRTQHPLRFAVAAIAFFVCAHCLRTRVQLAAGIAAFWGAVATRVLLTPGGIGLDGDLGALVAVAAPLAVFPVVAGGWWLRSMALASTGGLLAVLAATRNRGGAVGLTLAALSFVVLAPTWRWRLLALGPIVLALAVPFTSSEYRARFDDLLSRGVRTGSAGERLELWEAAGRMLHDHPLAGVGPGNFPSRVRAYDKGLGRRGAHNTVVAMFAETGWVGGTLFVALFVAGFAGAAATAWRGKAWRAPAAVAAGAALAGYLGAGMFVGRQTQVVAYALLGAVVALQSRYSTDA